MTLLWKYKQKHAFVDAQSRQGFLHRVQGAMVAAYQYLDVFVVVYLNDILVYSKTYKEHI
jgi:hypothetical protein